MEPTKLKKSKEAKNYLPQKIPNCFINIKTNKYLKKIRCSRSRFITIFVTDPKQSKSFRSLFLGIFFVIEFLVERREDLLKPKVVRHF